MTVKHSAITHTGGEGNHSAISVEYPTATDRENHTNSTGEPWESTAAASLPVGLIAQQMDDDTVWCLVDNVSGTLTWSLLSTNKATVEDLGFVHAQDAFGSEGFDAVLVRTGIQTYGAVRWVLDATGAPTPAVDNTAGFAVGSRYIDTTNDKEYVCLDASTNAAVWVETTYRPPVRTHVVEVPVTPSGSELRYFVAPYDLTITEIGYIAGGSGVAFDSSSGDVTCRVEADPDGTGVLISDSGSEVLDPSSLSARSTISLSGSPADLDVAAGTKIEIEITYPADTVPASGGVAILDILYTEQ